MPDLSIALLGAQQVQLADQRSVRFPTTKVQALLAFLAVEAETAHTRDTLIGLLWSDYDAEHARQNLRKALQHLRRIIPVAYLRTTNQTVQFNPARNDCVDVTQFSQSITAIRQHAHADLLACSACIARLEEAVALYRGDFLTGFFVANGHGFEEWMLLKREWLRREALTALYQLAAFYQQQGVYASALRYAQRQVELDPTREEAHFQLMHILAQSGQRSAALAQYQACQQILARELSVAPDRVTQALYTQIRSGVLPKQEQVLALPWPHPSQESKGTPGVNGHHEQGSQAGKTLPIDPPATPAQSTVYGQQLPALVTPFVGRENELHEIIARLQEADVRLLTLVGAGGMGKTCLALEVGRTLLKRRLTSAATSADYPDGVFFVPLAPLTLGSAIAPAIAFALGVELHSDNPIQKLLHFLRDKQILLILDNFEHLLADAAIVTTLLEAAPHVKILVTSRERLNVRGEHLYLVQGMDYAAKAAFAEAETASSVRLFVQSARRAQPRFTLSEQNLAAVLRICQLVQGMPLALELAAIWTELLPLEKIAQEIENNLDFLAADWRDAPDRQRSMRGVFEWSWKMLSDGERQVFRQLSVFRGGFTSDAAYTVTGASLRVLTSLVHKSLVSVKNLGDRYELHEVLRQFAAQQLATFPEERAAVDARHRDYYLHFVAARARRLARNEPRQAAAEIQAEIDNIRQAWAWAARHCCLPALTVGSALWRFYVITGQTAEGEQALHLAIEGMRARSALLEAEVQPLLGVLLALRALLLVLLTNHPQVIPLAQEAIKLGEASNNVEAITLGYYAWGYALARQLRCAEARACAERALQLAQQSELGLEDGAASLEQLYEVEWCTHLLLSGIYHFENDYPGAIAEVTKGLQLCQALGKLQGESDCLIRLMEILKNTNDYPAARAYGERALQIARLSGHRWGEGASQLQLCDVVRLLGDYPLAAALGQSAITLFREVGDQALIAAAAAVLGQLYSYMGNPRDATEWFHEFWNQLEQLAIPDDEVKMDGLLAAALHWHCYGNHSQALIYAEKAWQIAQCNGGRRGQAHALLVYGHALLGVQRQVAASEAYEQALVLCQTLGNLHFVVEARAGLAQSALGRGDLSLAQRHVEDILPILAEHPLAGLDEPFFAYLTAYQVLAANGDPRAVNMLQKGGSLLHVYASRLPDDHLRRAFLENVPLHRALQKAYPDGALA